MTYNLYMTDKNAFSIVAPERYDIVPWDKEILGHYTMEREDNPVYYMYTSLQLAQARLFDRIAEIIDVTSS